MPNRQGAAQTTETQPIPNVGAIADRLLAACATRAPEGGVDLRALLEEALTVASNAHRRLADEQNRRRRLEALSCTDELTGLFNRRGFDDAFARALAVADRLGCTGVLAFIDLDSFKSINDRLGHLAGDAVLSAVADILRRSVRATDIVARFGGDEFVALLVHTATADGRRRAEALDRRLNAAVVVYGDYEIMVRASFGIQDFGPNDEATAVLAKADAAMYLAKHAKPRILRPWRRLETDAAAE